MSRHFSEQAPPHIQPAADVSWLMLQVVIAMTPALILQAFFFGPGILLQFLICTLSALVFEALALALSKKNISVGIKDYSIIISAWLIAFALPADAPLWAAVVATACAVWIGKHAFGGLGKNIFNPAMLGYATLIVLFPEVISGWPSSTFFDGLSQATPLAESQAGTRAMLMMSELPTYQFISAWPLINLAFLVGGIYLLVRGVIRWQKPTFFILGLTSFAMINWIMHGDSSPSPWFHLTHGAAMCGAFFIVTDPVSSAISPRGRMIFAFFVGALVFIIRELGGYPEGVAFAVLIGNAFVPLIDHFTKPRVYGVSS